MRLYVVEDTYQFDFEGSYIHGIFDDPNQALILQQQLRRAVVASWGRELIDEASPDYDAGIRSVVDQHCLYINTREVNLNETL